jgi:hypothetical protein
VYDMYHWHRLDANPGDTGRAAPASASRPRGAARTARTPAAHAEGPGAPGAGPAAHAVQVALDRRDNGGALGATRDE